MILHHCRIKKKINRIKKSIKKQTSGSKFQGRWRAAQAGFSLWVFGGVQVGLGGTISSSFHWFQRRGEGPRSVAVCGRSSMTAPQKGAPEGRGLEQRISSTRCVSSRLICHPLNLDCSSTGSISHIARTSAGTSNRSRRRRRTRDLAAESAGGGVGGDVTLDPLVLALLVSTTRQSTLHYLHLQR